MQGREDGGQEFFCAHKMKTVIAWSNSLKWKTQKYLFIHLFQTRLTFFIETQ